jgi:hypothetical protein
MRLLLSTNICVTKDSDFVLVTLLIILSFSLAIILYVCTPVVPSIILLFAFLNDNLRKVAANDVTNRK